MSPVVLWNHRKSILLICVLKRKKPKTSLMYDFNDTNKYKIFKNIYAKANHEVNPQSTHIHTSEAFQL